MHIRQQHWSQPLCTEIVLLVSGFSLNKTLTFSWCWEACCWLPKALAPHHAVAVTALQWAIKNPARTFDYSSVLAVKTLNCTILYLSIRLSDLYECQHGLTVTVHSWRDHHNTTRWRSIWVRYGLLRMSKCMLLESESPLTRNWYEDASVSPKSISRSNGKRYAGYHIHIASNLE